MNRKEKNYYGLGYFLAVIGGMALAGAFAFMIAGVLR